MYRIYSFEKLNVYTDAIKLSVSIRELIVTFPKTEQYDLSRQLKRAVDSIPSNLAEGSGRSSNLDQAHFTNIAYASALETINHLNLALEMNFIEAEHHSKLRVSLDKIIKQLNALYKYQINNKESLKKKVKKD